MNKEQVQVRRVDTGVFLATAKAEREFFPSIEVARETIDSRLKQAEIWTIVEKVFAVQTGAASLIEIGLYAARTTDLRTLGTAILTAFLSIYLFRSAKGTSGEEKWLRTQADALNDYKD